VGKITNDDTLGTPAAPLASGTSSSRSIGNDTLNGVAVTTTNTNVTPHYWSNLVDADGNVTIARIPQRDLHGYHTICESDTTTGLM
jgi:hypothetical protein